MTHPSHSQAVIAQGRGTSYSSLAPCRVETTPEGLLRFVDPSADWPDRSQPSGPHIAGHRTRRAPILATTLAMRQALGLGL